MNEYKCMNCMYGDLSVDDFPCDACYRGSMYEPKEVSETMINSTKESWTESLLRKIYNSVKEINEAVEKFEKLLEEQQDIVTCDECRYFEDSDLSGYCHNPETYAIKIDSEFGCI